MSASSDSGSDRRLAWAAGRVESAELDRRRARRMSPAERIAEGLALVRIARKLRAGRRIPDREHGDDRAR